MSYWLNREAWFGPFDAIATFRIHSQRSHRTDHMKRKRESRFLEEEEEGAAAASRGAGATKLQQPNRPRHG